MNYSCLDNLLSAIPIVVPVYTGIRPTDGGLRNIRNPGPRHQLLLNHPLSPTRTARLTSAWHQIIITGDECVHPPLPARLDISNTRFEQIFDNEKLSESTRICVGMPNIRMRWDKKCFN